MDVLALTPHPPIYHIIPVLQHGCALLAVFGFVVDGSNTRKFVRQALLDPVGVITRFVQQRACHSL